MISIWDDHEAGAAGWWRGSAGKMDLIEVARCFWVSKVVWDSLGLSGKEMGIWRRCSNTLFGSCPVIHERYLQDDRQIGMLQMVNGSSPIQSFRLTWADKASPSTPTLSSDRSQSVKSLHLQRPYPQVTGGIRPPWHTPLAHRTETEVGQEPYRIL